MTKPKDCMPSATPRNGEGPLWRLIRLWPVAVAIIAVSGSIYIMSDNVGDLQAAQKVQWAKGSKRDEKITELEKQTNIIEYRLTNMDNTLAEQKSDLKEILRQVSK